MVNWDQRVIAALVGLANHDIAMVAVHLKRYDVK